MRVHIKRPELLNQLVPTVYRIKERWCDAATYCRRTVPMKYWLIIVFFNQHNYPIGHREIAYEDEAQCYMAMDNVRAPSNSVTVQMECVKDSDRKSLTK